MLEKEYYDKNVVINVTKQSCGLLHYHCNNSYQYMHFCCLFRRCVQLLCGFTSGDLNIIIDVDERGWLF